uniref:Ankyrin repeat and SOCS box protein 18-like n=1 Tax=Sinocyclocheilus rhinocerous TaxID=307959 RepID=A0A673KZF8_9TELE
KSSKEQYLFQVDEKITSKNCDSLTPTVFPIPGLWSLEYKRELTSPLCIAAAQGFSECLQYLLEHGAHPNLIAGGKAALHEACANANTECVELLLEHGLYLRFGACVNHSSSSGETPLGVVCGVICRLLLAYGAKINSSDKERRSPLHKAARNVQLKLAELLLDHGADINAIDYNGCSPLSSVLQSSVVRQGWEPHRVVQTLLNRGSIKVWPQALLKSLFALEYKPRSLQHLCRSALRKQFGKNCCSLIPRLPVPKPLEQYLLLEPEGYID